MSDEKRPDPADRWKVQTSRCGLLRRLHLGRGRIRRSTKERERRAQREHVWGTNFAVENVHGEGRDKKGATLGHHGDELRIFVQITAVLDGVKTSPPP